MRKFLLLSLILYLTNSVAQNVHIEISDYYKKIDDKVYSTFQYAEASYSGSRPTLIFITDKNLLTEMSTQVKNSFTAKQEYTDVWILGIDNFDKENISEIDKKIIDVFIKEIIKYRLNNELPEFYQKQLEENLIYITKLSEVCNYFSCKKKF